MSEYALMLRMELVDTGKGCHRSINVESTCVDNSDKVLSGESSTPSTDKLKV
jgi:hypothetical protein